MKPVKIPIKLQLISDIHLEFYDPNKPTLLTHFIDYVPDDATSTYLLICGYLGYPFHKNFNYFLKNISDKYLHLFSFKTPTYQSLNSTNDVMLGFTTFYTYLLVKGYHEKPLQYITYMNLITHF